MESHAAPLLNAGNDRIDLVIEVRQDGLIERGLAILEMTANGPQVVAQPTRLRLTSGFWLLASGF